MTILFRNAVLSMKSQTIQIVEHFCIWWRFLSYSLDRVTNYDFFQFKISLTHENNKKWLFSMIYQCLSTVFTTRDASDFDFLSVANLSVKEIVFPIQKWEIQNNIGKWEEEKKIPKFQWFHHLWFVFCVSRSMHIAQCFVCVFFFVFFCRISRINHDCYYQIDIHISVGEQVCVWNVHFFRVVIFFSFLLCSNHLKSTEILIFYSSSPQIAPRCTNIYSKSIAFGWKHCSCIIFVDCNQ